MTDRPILFSGPMICALLEGRKTQTRRVITKRAADDALAVFGPSFLLLRGNVDLIGYAPGDRLWVREAWTARMTHGWTIADARSRMYQEEILYKADGKDSIDGWWPSIHMPREFSRLTLIVTDVRVQWLQEISASDCFAEGIHRPECLKNQSVPMLGSEVTLRGNARNDFARLWDSLNAERGYGWSVNPWVCAVSFTVHRQNIDQMEVA